MSDVSRKCICDTLLAKRECREKLSGFIRQVYNISIRNLRAGQLAPYVERRMRPNRYLDMQMNKRCTCEIIITVRGGVVQEVRSTIPCTNVCIADYDIDYEDSEHEERLNDIEERANQPGMYIVY